MIPRWDVEVAAGAGRASEAPLEIEKVPFARSLLSSLRIDEDYAHLVTVRGDSMLETLADGDNVLIDTSDQVVRREGIYVVAAGELGMIKRVQIIASLGMVRLISDNPRYEPQTTRLGDGEGFRVIGRAKLVMRVL
jgi:phage repressor protein C with HTH and peptisase S24 domain